VRAAVRPRQLLQLLRRRRIRRAGPSRRRRFLWLTRRGLPRSPAPGRRSIPPTPSPRPVANSGRRSIPTPRRVAVPEVRRSKGGGSPPHTTRGIGEGKTLTLSPIPFVLIGEPQGFPAVRRGETPPLASPLWGGCA